MPCSNFNMPWQNFCLPKIDHHGNIELAHYNMGQSIHLQSVIWITHFWSVWAKIDLLRNYSYLVLLCTVMIELLNILQQASILTYLLFSVQWCQMTVILYLNPLPQIAYIVYKWLEIIISWKICVDSISIIYSNTTTCVKRSILHHHNKTNMEGIVTMPCLVITSLISGAHLTKT